ncbi:hypothetical protein BDV93DRAFT_566401 [Ceratobasidium sp. AG-I]|nr:hypothetical protein BDV93DRAFT_566401 [Ceratobasidium sp. AG-I]
MARRYSLRPAVTLDNEINWLQEFETWKQRCRHTTVWSIMRRENQYAAQLERKRSLQPPATVFDRPQQPPNSVDGRLISQVTGIGPSPRSAKINAIVQLEDADPAILTIG